MFEDLLEETNWTGFGILYGMVIVVLWILDFTHYFGVIQKILLSILMLPVVLVIMNIVGKR